MTEPTIGYPNCKTEIKLTKSLAAPLIEAAHDKSRINDNPEGSCQTDFRTIRSEKLVGWSRVNSV
jgi:hypothetical protein